MAANDENIVQFPSLTSEVVIGHEKYTLFWSKHAYERSFERGSHPKLADALLQRTIAKINDACPGMLLNATTIYNRISIQDYTCPAYYVIALDKERKEIVVITYGDLYAQYPRIGDYTIKVHHNGSIHTLVWKFKYDELKIAE